MPVALHLPVHYSGIAHVSKMQTDSREKTMVVSLTPINDDKVDRNGTIREAMRCCQQIGLRGISVFAVPVAKGPVW